MSPASASAVPARLAVPGTSSPSASSSRSPSPNAISRANTPVKKLPLTTSRTSTYLQSIFCGLAFSHGPAKSGKEGLEDLSWSIAISEGFALTASEKGELHDVDLSVGGAGAKEVVAKMIHKLRDFSASQSYKIQLVAISEQGLPPAFVASEPLLLPTLWQKLDVIPFLIPSGDLHAANSATNSPSTSFFPPQHAAAPKRRHIDLSFLPPQSHKAEGEDRAVRAVKDAVRALSPTVKSATTVETNGQDGEVEVDRAGQIQLAALSDYRATTSPELWAKFIALSKHMKANQIRVSFFSATPQGGGVALMRHALIRLWRLVGVDVKWYCPEGHPAIFDITKRKFHNVLQGVNKPGVRLHKEEKEMFEKWTEANLETFWSEGAIDDRIIVIDDPQLSALIPLIRQRYPHAKVCFRSHIQIDTSLTDDIGKKDNVHRAVWEYLWSFIREADLFIAHPVKAFVPKTVLDSGVPVTYMPPSTDPLDGLNKPIGAADMAYYRQYFGRISEQQCGMKIDWARPYIMQVARFDPSKGIPILLESYLKFRQRLKSIDPEPELERTPQLFIAGHGSVDDPDGQPIFEQISDILHQDEYEFLRSDIAVVRVPPCDRTLGAILQGAWCATQLSTKEGFEVKVTEAVHKRIPIIISSAGGLPLQVKEGVTGFIVESGKSDPVADRLFELFVADECPLPTIATLENKGKTPNSVADEVVSDLDAPQPRINPSPGQGASQAEQAVGTSEDFWSVGNAVKWMTLWARLAGARESVNEDDGGVLANILGDKDADRWAGIEGRSVWETILGEKDDRLVI